MPWTLDPTFDADAKQRLTARISGLIGNSEDEDGPFDLRTAVVNGEALVHPGGTFGPNETWVEWWYDNGVKTDRSSGEFRWVAFEPYGGASAATLVNERVHTPHEAVLLRSLRIVEDHPNFGEYKLVLGDQDGRLYWHSRGDTYPLAITFEDFVRCQIEFLGFAGWLEVFADIPKESLDYKRQRERGVRVLASLTKLFPEADTRLLVSRLAAL